MKKSKSNARRDRAHLSIWGTTQVHLRSPYVIAWWSAAFPGFGHILMSKYIRGLLFFTWEIVLNMNAHINIAMIYSLTGQFQMAKEVLDTRWVLLYIPVYLYAIYDSYQSAMDCNKVYLLADHENANLSNFKIHVLGINYLDKRRPWVAFVWSLFTPGIGQLYIHQIITAFFVLIWWTILCYYSGLLAAVQLLFLGDFKDATAMLNPEWLMFMPSIYGFSAYDAYVNTVEINKTFKREQKQFLQNTYQHADFLIPQNKS